jgi:hypothetical protein
VDISLIVQQYIVLKFLQKLSLCVFSRKATLKASFGAHDSENDRIKFCVPKTSTGRIPGEGRGVESSKNLILFLHSKGALRASLMVSPT